MCMFTLFLYYLYFMMYRYDCFKNQDKDIRIIDMLLYFCNLMSKPLLCLHVHWTNKTLDIILKTLQAHLKII